MHNLLLALGGPNGETAVKVLNALTDAINKMTEVVRGFQPETLQNIALGIGALGTALVAGGAVAILAALGPAGWIAAGITALGMALTTVDWKAEWEKLGNDLKALSGW